VPDEGDTDSGSTANVHELYRDVNANIVMLLDRFAVELQDSSMRVHCECGRIDCTETVSLLRDEYEHARANRTHFIVATGHAPPGITRIVRETGQYTVVELGGDRDSG
jgi:hypothetical protein